MTMTTIGSSLQITGEVTSQEDITVHGTVKGQIQMKGGTLRIAQSAHVDAEVNGSSVTIDGAVSGSVTASARLELTYNANVSGTLTAAALVLHDGATFSGTIEMDRQAKGRNPAGLKIADSKAVAQ